jgi:hypothetical protein
MSPIDTRHLLAAVLAFAATTVIGLWSWNTLAELFGAPEAQFRHAVAVLLLITTVRLATRRRHPAFRRRNRP